MVLTLAPISCCTAFAAPCSGSKESLIVMVQGEYWSRKNVQIWAKADKMRGELQQQRRHNNQTEKDGFDGAP